MAIEIVTPEMRATCLEAHDALIDLAAERDRAIAAAGRLQAALSIAVPMLERHGEYRICALVRATLGDYDEAALAICGPVLVVDNTVKQGA